MSGTAGDRRAAAELLARIERDSAAAAAAERAYRGGHDLRDALWWAAHPGATAPSGLPDPAIELRRLRSAAFSREGQESEWVDAPLPTGGTGRLRRAEADALLYEARLERDRAALRTAIAAAGDPAAPSRTGGAASGTGADGHPGDDGAGDGPGDAATTHVPPLPGLAARLVTLRSMLLRRPVATTATLALVGMLAGAGITWATLNGGGGPSRIATAAPGAAVDAPSWDSPPQGSPPALEVFQRDATAEDALPPQFFLDSPAATARSLYTSGSLRVWGFLDRGQVCMFVQEGEAASGTCTARDSFGYAGITLMLSAEGTVMPGSVSGAPAPAITDLTWTPEGEIQIRSAPLEQR